MSSFFSDDEDASSRPDARPSQGRGRGRRAPPRLARHLRPNDGPAQPQPQPHNADASSSTFPSSPRVGRDTSFFNHDSESAGDVTGMTTFDMVSDPLFAAARGKSSRRLVDLDRDALLGGAGDIPLLPGEDSNFPNDAPHESDDDESPANDVTRLLTAWIRERGTPDLMTWHGELVEECLHKLGQQAEMLDLLRSDPKTSEEEHFKLIIVQTEMERVKYLVRAYLRCRLAKVEKFAQYITTTPEAQRLLSQLELSHAQKYTQLLHTHYTDSVLQSLPEKLRGLEVDFGTQRSMVRKPDKSAPVLIYCKKDLPDIVLSTGERAGLSAKSMHLVRYDLVERYIADGEVEVL
ncbi:GINS complex subunit [Naganishia albida]|nr:GINS complex subunit [Naganishia albida]